VSGGYSASIANVSAEFKLEVDKNVFAVYFISLCSGGGGGGRPRWGFGATKLRRLKKCGRTCQTLGRLIGEKIQGLGSVNPDSLSLKECGRHGKGVGPTNLKALLT